MKVEKVNDLKNKTGVIGKIKITMEFNKDQWNSEECSRYFRYFFERYLPFVHLYRFESNDDKVILAGEAVPPGGWLPDKNIPETIPTGMDVTLTKEQVKQLFLMKKTLQDYCGLCFVNSTYDRLEDKDFFQMIIDHSKSSLMDIKDFKHGYEIVSTTKIRLPEDYRQRVQKDYDW